MSSIFRNISGLLILLIIVLVTVGVLFNNLTKKSFYEESGRITVRGTFDKVDIYKSELGVSQIFASNENDMYFALGYMHAQDRLWQMDFARRVAEGKLSAILGKSALQYDILFRTIGINKVAEKIYPRLSLKSKSILQSYSDGINYFIRANSKNLPLEFDILNYKPEPWKAEHSLMILRLMAWELNLSWYSDVMFGQVIKKVGIENAKDFFPDYPEDAPVVVSDGQKKTGIDSVRSGAGKVRPTSLSNDVIEKNYSALFDLGKGYFNISSGFRKFAGLEGIHAGSNAWAISGNRTENGKPIIANDPHLALLAPSRWYEVSLYDYQKKYSVCGFSIPGIPGIAIGHNDVVSWGLTNLMLDDADFYILKKDSSDAHRYFLNNELLTLDSSVENIRIKDVPDEYSFTAYHTKLGPVVSNLEKTGFAGKQNFKMPDSEILALRWTGYEFSDEIESFYKINNSGGWNDFRNALSSFGSPGLNFIYADTSGNIGYQAGGLVPVRSAMQSEYNALIPSSGEILWNGFVPLNELPSAFNPKEGYIVSANNRPSKDLRHYISNLYEPPYRAERIEELINSSPLLTANDVKRMQNDVYSLQAKEFCSYLFTSFGDSTKLTAEIKRFLNLLRKWDFEFKPTSPAATLFAQFEIELYKNLYKDVLGEEVFEDYLFLKNIPVRNTAKLLKQNSSSLFENDFSKEQILRKSFYDAVSALIVKYGSDENKWEWGDVHKVTMKHPLGEVPALSSMLNIGPFKIGGSGTTVNNLEYGFSAALSTDKFECYLGPSMRMICDLSFIRRYFSILPTGESGQPLHRNYNDQARLWLNGDYKTVSTDFDDLKKQNLKVLTLLPSE